MSNNDIDISAINKVTIIGMIVNLFLSIIKLFAGFLGGSSAVVSDAVHSFSDLGTDVAVLWGVKFWSQPADEDHPYGHSRIESVVTSGIGIFLAVTAVWMGYRGLIRLINHDVNSLHWIASVGAFLSVIVKEILFRITNLVGQRVQSDAVIANAWHHRSDAFSSIPVAIVALIGYLYPDFAFLDNMGAIVVSIFILHVSWNIIRPAYDQIICRGVNEKEKKDLIEIALKTDGVRSVHAFRSRKMGNDLFVDFHLIVDPNITVRAGHDISTSVKNNIIKYSKNVIDTVIHIEPDDE